MVQTEVVRVDAVARHAEEARHAPFHRDRPVADADGMDGAVIVQGLRDDPDRVREVHDQGVRGDLLDRARVLEHRGDRAHRHREAAGPGGLLPEDPVLQRQLFVERPRAFLARSDRGEHEARAAEGGASVVLRRER